MNLENQVAIITGAGQGLGEALAYRVAGLGGRVALVDVSDKIFKVKSKIGEQGRIAEAFLCDIRDTEAIQVTVADIKGCFGAIDILINNAGVWTDNLLEETRPHLRKLAFDVNALGTIEFTKAVVPFFLEQDRGHVLNVISTAGLGDTTAGNNTRAHVYGATKWALTGYTKALKESLSGTGVRITGFFPGGVDTNLYENAGVANAHNQPWMMRVEDVADIVAFILTRPEDVLIEKLVATRITRKNPQQ